MIDISQPPLVVIPSDTVSSVDDVGLENGVVVTLRFTDEEVCHRISGVYTMRYYSSPIQFDVSAKLKFKSRVADAVTKYCAENTEECQVVMMKR